VHSLPAALHGPLVKVARGRASCGRVLVLAEEPLAEVADRAGAQPGDLHLARYHLALSEDRFPAVPQAADSSSDRQTVDTHPHLRLHRAVAALRQASAALKKSDQKETDLLDVIQQYYIF
jgi:hypothetical protein